MRKGLWLLLLCIAISACVGAGDIFAEAIDRIVDNYYVVSCEDSSDQSICRKSKGNYDEFLVYGMVYAVWGNDKYIVAKQHPHGDYDTTNYYIVLINRDGCTDSLLCDSLCKDSVIGPLTDSVFWCKTGEFGIKDDIRFRDVKCKTVWERSSNNEYDEKSDEALDADSEYGGQCDFTYMFVPFFIFGLLFIGIFFLVLVAIMAKHRNRDVALWVIIGFLATPLIAIIALLIMGNDETNEF